jgi:hypothetical protein
MADDKMTDLEDDKEEPPAGAIDSAASQVAATKEQAGALAAAAAAGDTKKAEAAGAAVPDSPEHRASSYWTETKEAHPSADVLRALRVYDVTYEPIDVLRYQVHLTLERWYYMSDPGGGNAPLVSTQLGFQHALWKCVFPDLVVLVNGMSKAVAQEKRDEWLNVVAEMRYLRFSTTSAREEILTELAGLWTRHDATVAAIASSLPDSPAAAPLPSPSPMASSSASTVRRSPCCARG